MLRLLPLLLLIGAVVALIAALTRSSGRPTQRGGFRPRAKARSHEPPGARGVPHSLSRAELQGVRDAYSSAAIDATQPLMACGGCQALYHEASVAALQRENEGRCAICGGADLAPVHLRD